MADTVKIEYTGHHWDGEPNDAGEGLHRPEEKAEVDPATARQLVAAGVAVYATKAAARAAGGDAEQAATAKS